MNLSCGIAPRYRVVFVVALLFGLTSNQAVAQSPTNTWNGTTSDLWSNAANWTPGAPASSASTILQFNASGATTYTATNDIANPFLLNGLLLNSTSSGAVSLAGSDLSFTANSGATPVLRQLGSGSVSISNNLVLTDNLTVLGSGAGTVTLAGSLSGTGTFTQRSGSLVLSGNNSGYLSAFTLANGILTADFTGSTSSKLGTGALTLGSVTGGSATLNISGNSSSAITQTNSSFTFNAGLQTISITSGAGFNATLLSGAGLTRNLGSQLAVNYFESGGGVARVRTTTAPGADTVFGWAIVGGSDFGVHASTTGGGVTAGDIVGLGTAGTAPAYTVQPDVSLWAAGQNITNNGDPFTGTLGAALSINTLRFNGSGGTVALGANNLTIASGGILLTSSVGVAATISGTGALTTGASTQDLVITNLSTQTLTISSNIGTLGGGVANPGAVTSAGNVTVSGLNFTTGGLFVNSGTFIASNATAAVATTPLELNNSAAAQANPLGRDGTVASAVTLGNGATLSLRLFSGTNATGAVYTAGNAIGVPFGTATFSIDRQAGTFTGKSIVFGALTIGDGARLNWNSNTLITAATGFAPSVTSLILGAGAGNQPTSHTLALTGGLGSGSNVALTVSGAITGASAGGATLNVIGTNAGVLTNPGLSLTTAAVNLTAINISGTARVFFSNVGAVGTGPISVGSGSILTANAANLTLTQVVTVASGGGITSRTNTFTLPTTGLPTAGSLVLQNDNVATAAMSLSGSYPTLTGNLTLQFGGALNVTAANAIGVTTLTGNLNAAGVAGPFTLTANYSPGTASTATPATTSLFVVNGTTSIGANDLIVAGTGSLTLGGQILTTGAGANTITKNGTGILQLNSTANSFTGVVTLGAGAGLRFGGSSVVTAGALVSGPMGTGNLNAGAGAVIQDNGAARIIHNNLNMAGNVTFSTSGTATVFPVFGPGSLTFEDAGLTVPSTTVINAAAVPTFTVTNTTTLSQAISFTGVATTFTKAGTGVLIIDAPLGGTGATVSAGLLALTANATSTGTFTVNTGGTINLANAGVLTGGGNVVIASGAILGLLPVSQAIIDKVGAGSAGVIALGIDSNVNLDFSAAALSGVRFGSAPPGFVYSGILTPNGNVYRLGGGNGSLYYAGLLSDVANSVNIGLSGTTLGDVHLLNVGNSYGGGTTLASNSSLVIRSAAVLGSASASITFSNAAITPRLIVAGNTTIANPIVLSIPATAPVAAVFDTFGFDSTITGGVTSAGGGTGAATFNKFGFGTLTLATTGMGSGITVAVTSGTLTTELTGAPLSNGNFTLGGTLNLTAATGAITVANALAATTFTYSGGAIVLGNTTGGPGLTLSIGNAAATGTVLTRVAGGFLTIRSANGLANLGTATGDRVLVSGIGTSVTNTNNIVPGFIIGQDNDAIRTGSHLNYDPTNGFQPATYGVNITDGNFTGTTASSITNVSTVPATVAASGATYALRTNQNISIAASQTLTIGDGGLVLNTASNTATALNGISGAGILAFETSEARIYTAGDALAATPTGARIENQITGSSGMVVSGPGELRLVNATNSFSGALSINGGILAITGPGGTTDAAVLGANKIITLRNGGTFRVTGGSYNPGNDTKDFVIDSTGGRFDIATGQTLILDDGGTFVGNGPLAVTGGGAFELGSQTYTVGAVFVTGATFRLASNVYGTSNTGIAGAITLNAGGILDVRATIPRTVILNGGTIAPASGTGGITNSIDVVGNNSTIGGAGTLNVNGQVVVESGVTNLNLGGAGTTNVNGVISGAANSTYSVTKIGTGVAVLSGDNTYLGGTNINGGFLTVNSVGALNSTGTISFAGGTLRFTANNTTDYTPRFSNAASQAYSVDTNGQNVTFATPLTSVGGSLSVSGAGSLLLNALNTYSGNTIIIGGGTVLLNMNDALPTTTTVVMGNNTTTIGNLNLNGFNQTIAGLTVSQNLGPAGTGLASTITIGAGRTLTVNGNVNLGTSAAAGGITNVVFTGGGSMIVNGAAATFTVGVIDQSEAVSSTSTVNMSGLASLTANLGTGHFRVGDFEGSNNANPSTLRMATTNTITAAIFSVGEDSRTTELHTVILGSGVNTINADSIRIGAVTNVRASGAVHFDAADTTGSITIRGSGALNTRSAISMVNTAGNTVSNLTATLDLANHTANIRASTFTMARRQQGGGTGTNLSTFSFNQGTLDITTLNMAERSGSNANMTGIVTAVVNLGDSAAPGTPGVTIGTINMSVNSSGTLALTTTASSTLNITGGNLAITTLNISSNTSNTAATITPTSLSTVNFSSAVATVGTIGMAVNTGTTSGAPVSTATLNVTSGTFGITNATTSINMANATVGRTSNSTISLTGGTVTVAGNIIRTGGAGTENTTFILNGATLDMSSKSIGSSTAPIGVGGALTFGSGTLKNLAELNGGGTLTKTTAGLLILDGNNTYTGSTVISAGTIQVGAGLASGTIGAGPITNNGTLAFNRSDALAIANNIGGSGVVNQIGGGVTTLSGTNSYLGATNVNAGVLAVNGNQTTATGLVTVASNATLRGTGTVGGSVNVAGGGTIKGGNSVGTLNVAGGTVTLVQGSILQSDVVFNATPADPNNVNLDGSLLNITGTGILNLVPTAGNTFTIKLVDTNTLLPSTNYTLTLAQVATAGNIRVNGAGVLSGPISTSNYVLATTSFAIPLTSSQLVVDASGTMLQLNFATAVPEPHHALLIAVLLLAGYYGIRRYRRPVPVLCRVNRNGR